MVKKIGVGITGSFCSMKEMLKGLALLKEEGYDLYCFMSPEVYGQDSRFFACEALKEAVKQYTDHPIYHTIQEAETFGPVTPLDGFVVLPCTGASLSKLAHGLCDNAVLMAVKATLRNQRPIVIAFYTNDALGNSGVNIMRLMNTKGFYFVPFGQDDYIHKPLSMVANVDYLTQTLEKALKNQQIQPVVIENYHG